ncbi:glycerophosphodiester phosphodiesterase family protein [Flagellimonas hadalis]|uniref:GP-PDE domain-containing protein n=1 Tax=Flagellimonas hadalis TaxID=2597517 RepID=A0A5N5IS98_9FLAO|nr:glycerophosphodiester phosphodiesterase family protein [Allomuricauda hadalis]KAB5491421.1 hypothetical protein FOT42_000280 [Allomuricauda hadalis]
MKIKNTWVVAIAVLTLFFVKYYLLNEEFLSILLWIVSFLLASFLKKKFFSLKKKTSLDDHIFTPTKKNFIKDTIRSQAMAQSKNMLRVSGNNNLDYIERLNWQLHNDHGQLERHQGTLFDLLSAVKPKQKNNFIIFGESGVGKTFAVFDYIHKRIEADADFTPIFIALSDWIPQKSLTNWTVNKASKIYHLDKDHLGTGLDKGIFFPIFDGLDRVKDEHILPLFESLMKMASRTPMAIVMKTETYQKLHREYTDVDAFWKLPFHLIELKTLKPKLVESILTENGDHQKLEIFRSNPKFKFLCRYPIFLNLLAGMDSKFIKENLGTHKVSHEQFFNQIWKWYELKMFGSPNFPISKKKENLKIWLRKMALNSGLFFPEELQPSYLDTKWSIALYYLGSRLSASLLVSMAAGLFLAGPFNFWDAAIIGGLAIATIDLLKHYLTSVPVTRKWLFRATGHRQLPPISKIINRTIPLIVILGIYYGFTTPRSPKYGGEMLIYGLFSTSEALVGIIVGLLLSIFFGIRSNWQKNNFDIKPVERIKGSLKNYFISGFMGGLLLAIIVVPIFYLFNIFTKDASTINAWLNQNLYVENKYLFAGFASFFLGYLFFGLFGFLHGNKVILEQREKLAFSKRSPITKSFVNGLKSALVSCLVIGAVLGSYIGLTEMEANAVFKALKTALGFGVLAFAWFGGLDAICHWLLRMVMAIEQGFPLRISSFMLQLSEVGFVRPVGSGFEFIHPSLRDYYKGTPLQKTTKHPMLVLLPTALVLLLAVPILLKLTNRFQNQSHWQNEKGFNVDIQSEYVRHEKGSKNKFVIRGIAKDSTQTIRINANGKVKLGSFIGFVPPSGTNSGFLGMSLGDTWNIPGMENLNHGSLAFRKNDGAWISFPENDLIHLGNNAYYLNFIVKNGDVLETAVNDIEWENNSGRFNITFEDMDNAMKTPKIVAHRGGAVLSAENSMEAIKNALQLGVDMVEIDIQMSRDGHLVVMHDRRVDRTTDGKGKVGNLDLDEIKKLRLKNCTKIETVPTLDEVLELISPHETKLLIEVKTDKNYDRLLKSLTESIKKRNMEEQVMVFSFNKSFCDELKVRFPELTVGVFIYGFPAVNNLPKVDAVGVEYHSILFLESYYERLKRKFGIVYTWNVNVRSSMQRLTAKNIDGIITDDPKMLKTLLEQ